MFTSVNSKVLIKRALIYFGISVFLIVFNLIYGLFAHGVRSNYMQFVFFVPFIGGTIPSLILTVLPQPSFIQKNVWRMGITSIIIGFLLKGVFEIYGTVVSIMNVYIYIGICMLIISILLYGYSIMKHNSNQQQKL